MQTVAYRSSFVVDTDNPPPLPKVRQDHDDVLLTIHRLGQCTIEHLSRLHCDDPSQIHNLQRTMRTLHHHQYVTRTQQRDPQNRNRKFPILYSDATKGRRRLEDRRSVPYRRLSHAPASSFNNTKHNLNAATALTALSLTARSAGIPIRHVDEFAPDGAPLAIPATFNFKGQRLKKRIKPDFTLQFLAGKTHTLPFEVDRGTMPVVPDDPHRSSLLQKFFGYGHLRNSTAQLEKTHGISIDYIPFIVSTRAQRHEGSTQRIANILDAIKHYLPKQICPHKFLLFIEQERFEEADDDVSSLRWIDGRGDEVLLPSFPTV